MGKLFLSMLIGAIVMLVVNDDSRGGLRDSAVATVSTLVGTVSR